MAWTDPATGPAATGEIAPASLWNTFVRDNMLVAGPHLIVRKPSNESVTSSTVLQADNDLILPVLANEVWQFTFFLVYTAAVASGDMKCRFTFPTGGDLRLTVIYANAASVISHMGFSGTTSPSTTNDFDGAGTIALTLPLEGVFVNGANAGNLALEWAQQTSNATPTVMLANSTLWGMKLA